MLTAERGADGAAALAGNAPDADAARDAARRLRRRGRRGAPAPTALTLADGAPIEAWAPALAQLLAIAAPLETWRLDGQRPRRDPDGVAPDAAARDAAAAQLHRGGRLGGLHAAGAARGRARCSSTVGGGARRSLRPARELRPADRGAAAGRGASRSARTVVVTGNVADAGGGRAAAGRAGRGDRRPHAAGRARSTLNPALCSVLALLPPVPTGGDLGRPRLRRPRGAEPRPASTVPATTR